VDYDDGSRDHRREYDDVDKHSRSGGSSIPRGGSSVVPRIVDYQHQGERDSRRSDFEVRGAERRNYEEKGGERDRYDRVYEDRRDGSRDERRDARDDRKYGDDQRSIAAEERGEEYDRGRDFNNEEPEEERVVRAGDEKEKKKKEKKKHRSGSAEEGSLGDRSLSPSGEKKEKKKKKKSKKKKNKKNKEDRSCSPTPEPGEIDEDGAVTSAKKKKKKKSRHHHDDDDDDGRARDVTPTGDGRRNDATPTGAARELGTPHFEERVKTPVESLEGRDAGKSCPESHEKAGGGRRKRKETGSDGEWNSDEDEMSEGELERKKRLILEQLGEDDMD